MKTRIISTLLLVPAFALLGACGGSDPDAGARPEAPQEQSAPEPALGDESEHSADDAPDADEAEGADDAADDAGADLADAAPAAVLGTVEAGGVTYEITQVRRCDPLQTDMVDRELEVQGLGEQDGQRVQIDVYVQQIAGTQLDDVSWAGPEGIFGSPEDAQVVFDGSTVSGSATLRDAHEHVETLAVSFELEVPDEILQCR